MTQRQNNKSSPRIALIIPAQQAPDSGSFPTAAKAVSHWLNASAAGGVEARVSALITALKHSNRLQNKPAERLKILDIFIAELQQLLPELRARFAETDFPQTAHAESAFSQTALLLLEISYGYKISLVDTLLGRGSLTQKGRVHTIYRAIKAIGDCGLHQSLGYRNWTAKSWRDLNTLFLLAEHENAHEIPINTGSAKNYPETIQGLYIAYALLNASGTRHLRRQEISTLFSSLCNSAGKFRLTKVSNNSSAKVDFSVALNSKNAPAPDRFCNYPDNAKLRYLSLDPLMSLFSTGMKTGQISNNLSHSQQRKLNQIWLHTTKRQSPRSIRNTTLFAQSGLENITETLSTASRQHRVSELFSTHWILLNQSPEGLGLQAGSNGKHNNNIGELIAYEASQSVNRKKPWCRLGVTRWLSNQKDTPIRIGVETIAERVESVTITARVSHKSEATNTSALLGINIDSTDNEVILMMTEKRFKSGDSITLSVGASSCYRNCMIALGDEIDQRGNFDCFKLSSMPLQ